MTYPKVDPSNWIGIEEFTAWQAACILCGIEPFTTTRDKPAPQHITAMQTRVAQELNPDRDTTTRTTSYNWVMQKNTSRTRRGVRYYKRAKLETFAANNGLPFLTQGGQSEGAEHKRIIPFREPDRRKDDWPDVLIDAIRQFETKHGFTANEAQLWSQVTTNPPPGYAVQWEDRQKQLTLRDNPPMDRASFSDRFARLYPETKPA